MRANQEMLIREIAGETLLIPTGQMAVKIHGMIALSESGAFLWKKLSQDDCSKEDLVQSILDEYEIDRETADRDVDEFIEKMRAVGIIKE